jgi:Tol biopolymer transport system component
VAPPPTGQIVRATPSVDALVAVSLDDPSAKPIELLSYISAADGVPMPSNLLRAQFSPDGHRLVLSVIASSGSTSHAGIVIVDLIVGTATQLASDPRYNDVTPAWRPNGEQVAFVRSATGAPPAGTDARIVLIGADGAGFREVLPPSTSRIDATLLLRWNGDGSGIAYLRGFERSPLYVLDLATGRSGIVGELGWVAVSRGAVDWRGATPAFAGTLTEGPSGPVRFLAVADGQLATPSRDVVVLPSSGVVNLDSPRWRPASNEILYVKTTNEPSSLSQLLVTDATGAAPRELLRVNALSLPATWTRDGRQIVYLRGNGSGQDVHLLNADGTADRAVGSVGGSVVPEAPSEWPDLAVLSL